MKTVYLGGPIAGCTYEDLHGWREEVKKSLVNYNFLDPSDRVYPDETTNHFLIKKIVTEDKVDIGNSNVVLTNLSKIGTYKCVGSIMEIVYGFEMGKYVIVIQDPDYVGSPWITYHSHKIVTSVQEAIEHLEGLR